MKRLTTLVAASVVAAGLAGSAMAQQKASEIAVIDTQVLLEKAEAAKNARQQIDRLRAEIVQTFNDQQGELRVMNQTLAKDRATLPEEAFQQRMREIVQKNADIQRAAQERQQKLDAASRAAAQKIEAVVHEIVDEFKKERRYTLVVVRSATMGKPTVPDITDDVLGRLDRRMPTVEVTLQ
jgi:Skp family chaperone for outer membrane proteins